MSTEVKICGVTSPADAALAIEFGADMIGMVLWPGSPRAVTVSRAREIAAAMASQVECVGVFVDTGPDEVLDVAKALNLDIVQLHGGATVDVDAIDPATIFQLTTLDTDADVQAAVTLPEFVIPLVDATDRVRRGGTGRLADWSLAARLAAIRPIVLAGGLTADNVGEAIRRVRPWAVDVSSGVEARPGVKSPARIRAFFAAVRAADGEET